MYLKAYYLQRIKKKSLYSRAEKYLIKSFAMFKRGLEIEGMK